MRDLTLAVSGGSLLLSYATMWAGFASSRYRASVGLRLMTGGMQVSGFTLVGMALWGVLR